MSNIRRVLRTELSNLFLTHDRKKKKGISL